MELFHFDIETSGQYPDYQTFLYEDVRGAKLFQSKFDKMNWIEKYVDIRLVTNEKMASKLIAKPNYDRRTIFDENIYKPCSILEVDGARDIAVEFSSVSKSFSLAGARIGFASGNKDLIAALYKIKSYLDYGAYTPIQVAAAAALNGPDDCIKEMRAIYKKRRDALVESFAAAGWDIPVPQATMFAWVPLPEKFKHLGSLEFSKLMVEKADVAVAPGIAFGPAGEGSLRICYAQSAPRLEQAMQRLRAFVGA